MSPRTISVRVEQLPQFRDLYLAVHRVLVERLTPPHEISIQSWNALIKAHDSIANRGNP